MNNKSIQSRIFKGLNGQFAAGETVVIAVSGGTDSLALLHLLCAIRHKLGVELHAATLDHGLRGEQSADDARYVEQIAAQWGVACTRGVVDVRALSAEWSVGIETAARRARYDFLADILRTIRAYHLLTAHHADDQAETVLMRILRGTGIEGLGGMHDESPMLGAGNFALVRPLLNTTKAELVAYCAEANIIPREDATNAETHTVRNRLRHEILPLLRTINPQVDRALIQLADVALVEDELIDAQLQTILMEENILAQQKQIVFPQARFGVLETALQRRFIVWAARRVMPEIEMNFERVLAAVRLAVRHLHGDNQVGALELLGDGVRFRIDYNVFIIERGDAPLDEDVPLLLTADHEIALEATTTLYKGWMLHAASTLSASISTAIALHIPPDATLKLRGRRAGDRMSPRRLNGHSCRLSRWMIDQKIPAAIRDRIPILTVNDNVAAILWLLAPQIEQRFTPTDDKQPSIWIWIDKPDFDTSYPSW